MALNPVPLPFAVLAAIVLHSSRQSTFPVSCRPIHLSRMKSGWKSHPALPRSLRSLPLARQSYSLLLTAPARQLPAAMLVQHIDQLVVKRRDVVRLAAADPVAIDDHFFIHPVATGIADIVLQR